MKRKTEVLVVGAGISGCAAAQELQANNIDYLLIERNVKSGGLTRSISLGNAHFDYTGHFLHLARLRSPEEIPYAKQHNKDWQLIKRKSVVYVEDTVVPAPFQYNLFALPEKTKNHCINDYRNRPIIDTPNSFREYLLSGFGQGMCDTFLYPYNEKMQAIDLNDLSVDAVKRFFPVPDEQKIEKGYSKSQNNGAVGYNSCFWYPKKNGIGKLAKGLAVGLDSLLTCYPVEKLDLNKKVAYTPLEEIHYNKVITSIPLKEFSNYCVMPELQQLSSSLSHNKVLCVNILVKGSFNKDFQGCHWIYVPDKAIPFYRVGIYSNLPDNITPANHTSIYVEVAKPSKKPINNLCMPENKSKV